MDAGSEQPPVGDVAGTDRSEMTDRGGDAVVPPEACTTPRASAEVTTFGLPPGYGARAFQYVGIDQCNGANPAFSVMDVNGDLRPDLVVRKVCASGATVGTDHWRVYLNMGAGFATEPTTFALPPGYGALAFQYLGIDRCSGANPAFSVMDVNGDLRPDLVVRKVCASGATVGTDHWRVHLNTDMGFAAEPTTFALPPGYGALAFQYLGIDQCSGSNPAFSVMDVNGDRRPDLVVRRVCASGATVGTDHWRVHLNTGVGFAAEATSFGLPPGYGALAFQYLGIDQCSGANPAFSVMDVNGDLRPDLVVRKVCASGATVGTDHWRVHLNTDMGFAAEPTTFALPPGYGARSFELLGRPSCSGANPGFSVMDLNGDRRPDVVILNTCGAGSTVGTDHWDVFTNVCS